MINWVAVGTRIQTKRLEKKMTQQHLAELTDYSEVYIGYIEQGKRKLSIESMIRISDALECSIEDLLNYKRPVKTLPGNVETLVEGCNVKEKAAIMLAIQAIVDMVYTLHPQS